MNDNLKNKLKKVVEEVVQEMSVSADAGAYPSKFMMKKKIQEHLDKIIKKELLNEVTYNQFKKNVSYRTKNEMLHKSIREVKRKLQELDRVVDYTSRMKQELHENEEGIKYWKTTSKYVNQISEMVNHLNNKIKNLQQ